MRARATTLGFVMGLIAVSLSGCGEEGRVKVPPPQEPTRDATSYYDGMILLDQPGPKAQIFLVDRDAPLWFASVRDAIAFTMLAEEPKNIIVFYVTDMTGVKNWDASGAWSWMDARRAWYVIDSSRRGSGNAPEAIPFSDLTAADKFAKAFGGKVVGLGDVPHRYVLSELEGKTEPAATGSVPERSGADPAPAPTPTPTSAPTPAPAGGGPR